MDAKELAEYEDYYSKIETETGPHRADLFVPAGQILILIEILRSLNPLFARPKEDKNAKAVNTQRAV